MSPPPNPSRSPTTAAPAQFWFEKEGVARALYNRLRAMGHACTLIRPGEKIVTGQVVPKWGVLIEGNRPAAQRESASAAAGSDMPMNGPSRLKRS